MENLEPRMQFIYSFTEISLICITFFLQFQAVRLFAAGGKNKIDNKTNI
jgi:hypothetical protein